MIGHSTTDSIYPLTSSHLPRSFSSVLPVLPPSRPAFDYLSEYDTAPIDENDFIDSIRQSTDATQLPPFSGEQSNNDTLWLAPTSYGNDSYETSFDEHNYTASHGQSGPSYYVYMPCEYIYSPDDEFNKVEFWICGVCLNIVGLLGIIGNIVSMIILSRPQMRSSINCLLIGLACCDTVLITTSILLFGIPSIYPHTGRFFLYYNYVYPYSSPVLFPLAVIAQTASIYMTFTVTLERYVAVCHPLKARALCTYGRAKIYFFVCALFALLYNLPRFWEVDIISTKVPEVPEILNCVRPSVLRQNPVYINIYIHWCYLIVNYIIPFLTLAILNCLIYRQVKRANRERQRLSRSEKREIGLATMLLCVVVVFFVFNFLALVLNLSEAFYNTIDNTLTKTSNLLVTINSSCNFLIYVIFGEKFKRIFLLIFFKRRLSRDQPDLIHYESSISNNGDGTLNNRPSGRLSRHGPQRSNATTHLAATTTGTALGHGRLLKNASSPGVKKIKRGRTSSPGPIVYYPAREVPRISPVIMTNNNSPLGCDWIEGKGGQTTSDI